MKKLSITFFATILLMFFFSSCKDEKLEYFKITIVLTHDLGASDGDPLNSTISALCNYINSADTVCDDIIFVPQITIVRPDINPERTETFEIQLSSLNKWRKSMDLLSASNLKEDYAEQIPKLKTTGILSAKSNRPVDVSSLLLKYPNAKILAVGDKSTVSINAVSNEIASDLCKKNATGFVVILKQPESTLPLPNPPTPGPINPVLPDPKPGTPKPAPLTPSVDDTKLLNAKVQSAFSDVNNKLTKSNNNQLRSQYSDIYASYNNIKSADLSAAEKEQMLNQILAKLDALIYAFDNATPLKTEPVSTASTQGTEFYEQAVRKIAEARQIKDKKHKLDPVKNEKLHTAWTLFNEATKNGRNSHNDICNLIAEFKEYFPGSSCN